MPLGDLGSYLSECPAEWTCPQEVRLQAGVKVTWQDLPAWLGPGPAPCSIWLREWGCCQLLPVSSLESSLSSAHISCQATFLREASGYLTLAGKEDIYFLLRSD